jgi:hypothetical protein
LAISVICFVLAFTAKAFYHCLTGAEISIRRGRLMLLAASIAFLALAIRDLLFGP